jgi:tetratricopeptide (TPR) repeat protein
MNPVLKMKYQFQSGAAWFKAGKPNQAQQRMNQVVESSNSGELGPKASLIRVMSLKSMGLSGRDTLSEAIRTHLLRFSDDKMTTGEVRWIEGESDLSVGSREDAMIAWEAIPPAHPRWMAAQLAMSNIGLERLEELVLISDIKEFATQWEKARRRLERARDSAPTLQDKNTLELAIARIDMTPGSDRTEAARQTCLRLMPVLTRESQRQWANAILIMTDALLSRSLDLETRLSQRDKSMDPSLILDMCRVMDTSAQMIDTEITRRQLGSAMARLAESLPVSGPELTTAADQELELRRIRGLIYAGQPSSAEPRLDRWITANPNVKPTLLYAVADALLRLNATSKAIRYLSQWVDHEAEGTTQWFLGRLELAKALYREGRDKEAAKLIDATLLLYPDAGGPGLKKRYDKFRRSLNK